LQRHRERIALRLEDPIIDVLRERGETIVADSMPEWWDSSQARSSAFVRCSATT
jgi:hypothetical protein